MGNLLLLIIAAVLLFGSGPVLAVMGFAAGSFAVVFIVLAGIALFVAFRNSMVGEAHEFGEFLRDLAKPAKEIPVELPPESRTGAIADFLEFTWSCVRWYLSGLTAPYRFPVRGWRTEIADGYGQGRALFTASMGGIAGLAICAMTIFGPFFLVKILT